MHRLGWEPALIVRVLLQAFILSLIEGVTIALNRFQGDMAKPQLPEMPEDMLGAPPPPPAATPQRGEQAQAEQLVHMYRSDRSFPCHTDGILPCSIVMSTCPCNLFPARSEAGIEFAIAFVAQIHVAQLATP